MSAKLAEIARRDCREAENERRSMNTDYHCDHHPVRVCENLQILSIGMEFSKNLYANVLKAPIHN